jgi:Phage major capsid protein E
MLEIFTNNAFGITSLTLALNQVPFVPGLIGDLKLFDEKRLSTTTTMIEVRGERLALVPERPRGAPPTPDVRDGSALIPVAVPHFPVRTSLFADAVQNVRAFGTEDQLQSVIGVVNDREAGLGRRLDLTLEYLRLGAVKGIITTAADRDTGAPLQTYNLFTAFNVPQQAELSWPIIGAGNSGDVAAWGGQLTGLVNDLGRKMADAISGGMYQRIHGVAGKTFFDAFAMHPEQRQPYIALVAQTLLDAAKLGSVSVFKEVTIQEYRGQVGNIKFVADDECHFFPVGAPDLFIEPYAPADYMETVNTIALPRYSKMREMDFDKGVEIEAQMNVIPMCTQPRTLFTAKAVAFVPPTVMAAAAESGTGSRRAA